MTAMTIPNKTWILVGDGRKALVLRNEGDATFPNLRTVSVFSDKANPTTAGHGTDRPGKSVDHATGRRSAMEETDWHEVAEHRFAHSIAARLGELDAAGEIPALVVIAPPRTLAELRTSFTESLTRKIIGEVNKDYTHHPLHEIERLLTGKAA